MTDPAATYVTMLAERGVHERVAQQLAGHADSRTTREIYTDVTGAMLDGAADAIEDAVADLHGSGLSAVGPELGPGENLEGRSEPGNEEAAGG